MILMICVVDAYATTDIICQYLKGLRVKAINNTANTQTNNNLDVMNRLVAIRNNYYIQIIYEKVVSINCQIGLV